MPSMLALWSSRPLALLLLLLLILTFLGLGSAGISQNDERVELTCSVSDEGTAAAAAAAADPNLQPLVHDVGDGLRVMQAYVTPDVTSFYRDRAPPADHAVPPKHKGFGAKFINMSNRMVRLFWIPNVESNVKSLVKKVNAFSSGGSSSFPGHRFYITPENDPDHVLCEWVVGEYPNNLHFYDPYLVEGDDAATQRNLQSMLSDEERVEYNRWNRTRAFDEIYRNVTGRPYMVNYLRDAPKHFMWPTDYLGQQHWVTTAESYFVQMPPADQLGAIQQQGTARILKEGQRHRLLAEYRTPINTSTDSSPLLNLTVKVLSCAPKVFQIENFLSSVEVEHILQIAKHVDMEESIIGEGGEVNQGGSNGIPKVRTSYNGWIGRESSPIIDAIYRRAADVLRIDESLLRSRPDGEHPEIASKKSMAEPMQLIHYNLTQEFATHHDYCFSDVALGVQPERFATLIIYLNQDMEGGETSFPRWVNAETADPLNIQPQAGTAVLFYNILPDGNMDDLSQHAGLPVTKGEKWMTNMWIWDPHFRYHPWFG